MQWILSRVAGKYLLTIALASLGINVAQYVWHQWRIRTTDARVVQLAVNEALLLQQAAQDSQLLQEANAREAKLKEESARKDALLSDRESRGDRWKREALKFKNKYLEVTCDDDPDCKSWANDSYRGDG